MRDPINEQSSRVMTVAVSAGSVTRIPFSTLGFAHLIMDTNNNLAHEITVFHEVESRRSVLEYKNRVNDGANPMTLDESVHGFGVLAGLTIISACMPPELPPRPAARLRCARVAP
jgi:hypothetical protein